MLQVFTYFLLLVSVVLAQDPDPLPGLLYPRESPSRERKDLSGIWNFRPSPQQDQDVGFREKWYTQPLDKVDLKLQNRRRYVIHFLTLRNFGWKLFLLQQTGDVIPMPVPSSFNDITQNTSLRDYLGWVWYDTEFFVPERWRNSSFLRTSLYFGSAHYNAMVVRHNFIYYRDRSTFLVFIIFFTSLVVERHQRRQPFHWAFAF